MEIDWEKMGRYPGSLIIFKASSPALASSYQVPKGIWSKRNRRIKAASAKIATKIPTSHHDQEDVSFFFP